MEYAITVIQRGNINILGGIITFAGDEIHSETLALASAASPINFSPANISNRTIRGAELAVQVTAGRRLGARRTPA